MLHQFSMNLGSGTTAGSDPRTESVLFDDFAYDVNVNQNGGPMGLYAWGQNGGAPSAYTSAPAAAMVNHIGLLPMSYGTTNNSTGFAQLLGQMSGTYPGACTQIVWECCLYTPAALSDSTNGYVIDCGFRNTQSTGVSTNACSIVYDQTTSTNWQAYTSNNGSATTVTTANSAFVVNANAFYNLKIVMISGLVSFYIASGTGAYALLGTSATNLPDSTHRTYINCIHYKNTVSAVARIVTYDWMKLDTTLTR